MMEVSWFCEQQAFGFVINGAFGFVIPADVDDSMKYFDL